MLINVAYGDYPGLVQEIVIARNCRLISEAGNAIEAFLRGIGWEAAKEIVDRLTRMDIPRTANIAAKLKDLWGEYNNTLTRYHEWEDRKKAVDEEYVAPGELEWFMAALKEAMAIPYCVASFSPSGELVIASLERWEAAGQPKHWKRVGPYICDNPRYANAYDRSVRQRDDSLAEYYKNYYDALVAYREKRNASKAVAA